MQIGSREGEQNPSNLFVQFGFSLNWISNIFVQFGFSLNWMSIVQIIGCNSCLFNQEAIHRGKLQFIGYLLIRNSPRT